MTLPTNTWLVHPSLSMADLFMVIGVNPRWMHPEYLIKAKQNPKPFWVSRAVAQEFRVATPEEVEWGQWKEA